MIFRRWESYKQATKQRSIHMKTEDIPPISAAAEDNLRIIAELPEVRKALNSIHERTDAAMKLQVELCEIPAPTFKEGVRAKRIVELMHECGLEDVSIDGIGNVVGRWPGTDPKAPLLAIGAHMDTVFPEGTDVTVRQEGSRYYGPGIGDNCSGLRAVLETLRAMKASGIRTKGSILFMGTVGEEGLGDIRGSKYLFDKSGLPVDGFLAVDNTDVGRILYGAIGSHRWRFTVKGPGGHSYGAFGITPSAIHAICIAGAKVAYLKPPKDPKTTFTIGTIKGGTSVNTIAADCSVDVDIRSLAMVPMLELEKEIRKCFAEGVEEENRIWGITDPEKQLRLVEEMIGDRPAGLRPHDCPVLQASRAAQAELGIALTNYGFSSTDANKPVSMGIPATCLSAGGRQMRTHTVDEYFDAVDIHLGPQLILLSALALVGTEATEPMLPVRKNG